MRYQIVSDGGAPRFEQVVEPAPPPQASATAEIRQFLIAQGWSEVYGYGVARWQRKVGETIYTWEQAMAIEFHRFINLGTR